MGKRANPVVSRWIALLVVASMAIGCGGKVGTDKAMSLSDNQKHLMKAFSLWGAYRHANKNKAPATIDELKAWAKKLKPAELERLSITDVDEALTCPSDGKPYGINPMSSAPAVGRGPPGMTMPQGVVMYEQGATGGKHWTVSSMGSPGSLTDAELKDNVPSLR